MSDEIDFTSVSEETEQESKGLTLDDFKGNSFLKNPAVGNTITLTINKIVNNPVTTMKNKTTGKEFPVGLKAEGKEPIRYDIHCEEGIYTISNWELYFKLLGRKVGSEGVIVKYMMANNKDPKGCKLTIKKLLDASYANYKVADLAKVLNKTEQQAQAYIDEIKLAIKEKKLYEVKAL